MYIYLIYTNMREIRAHSSLSYYIYIYVRTVHLALDANSAGIVMLFKVLKT